MAELTSAVTAVSAAALAILELTAVTTKQTAAENGGTNEDDQIADTDSVWGWNSANPKINGHQGSVPKKQKN